MPSITMNDPPVKRGLAYIDRRNLPIACLRLAVGVSSPRLTDEEVRNLWESRRHVPAAPTEVGTRSRPEGARPGAGWRNSAHGPAAFKSIVRGIEHWDSQRIVDRAIGPSDR